MSWFHWRLPIMRPVPMTLFQSILFEDKSICWIGTVLMATPWSLCFFLNFKTQAVCVWITQVQCLLSGLHLVITRDRWGEDLKDLGNEGGRVQAVSVWRVWWGATPVQQLHSWSQKKASFGPISFFHMFPSWCRGGGGWKQPFRKNV